MLQRTKQDCETSCHDIKPGLFLILQLGERQNQKDKFNLEERECTVM